MPSLDPRIDAYIARSADFAQPLLHRLRSLVHEACPQVEENIKWGTPSFTHAGGILCGMAAFKQHVSFGFWKHALVMGEEAERDGMGSFGKMATLSDVPPKKTMTALIRKAMRLNEQGLKLPGTRKTTAPRAPLEMPDDLLAALKKNRKARATFDGFSPSARREYVEWIVEGKREETRQRRIAQAVEWMAEGKVRNWKYASC
ncbi:MAG TPA: YdeI/OmpD-associated family protein [Pseudoxanthomonas sp.]